MLFDNFNAGRAFSIGQIVKPQEPYDSERLTVPLETTLPVGRFIKRMMDANDNEYATPLETTDTISSLYGIVLDDLVEENVRSNVTFKPTTIKFYESGQSAPIGRLSAKLSFVPYIVIEDSFIETSPIYLYVIKSGENLGAVYVSNSSSKAPSTYIRLDSRFTFRPAPMTKDPYMEFNPVYAPATPSLLPIATTSSLGVIKVGEGFTIQSDGTLSVKQN
jgi:hypothetical protein